MLKLELRTSDEEVLHVCFFFFSSRRRHTRCSRDWSSDVCSSDLSRRAATGRPALVPQLPHPSESRPPLARHARRQAFLSLDLLCLPKGPGMDIVSRKELLRGALLAVVAVCARRADRESTRLHSTHASTLCD